jgi:hypothetical protein
MIFRGRLRVFCVTGIILFLCAGTALAVVSSGLVDINDIKRMAKPMLKGYVDPKKLDTGLPLIKIDTYKRQPITSKERYIRAEVEIIDPNNAGNNLKGDAEIRGRGNSTWQAVKKPYRLRFLKKTSLFGYEKAKSWVLLANDQDPTLILNTTAFELGRRFGLPFTPHYTHVELILNGRYQGSYVLTEQVQAGLGRVEINEDEGFLVELDDKYDEDPKFRTDILELPAMIKHPEDLAESSGYDFVKNALNELESALFAVPFPNTVYHDLIDMDTFIDFIMINEITRNTELLHPASIFLYRDGKEDTRIKMGPLWDFDYAFNIDDGVYFTEADDKMPYSAEFSELPGYKFFSRFFEDPVFRARYKERWNDKYPEIASMETFIGQMAVFLTKSQQADHKVWWWKEGNVGNAEEETGRMKDWWRRRIAYMNTEINSF